MSPRIRSLLSTLASPLVSRSARVAKPLEKGARMRLPASVLVTSLASLVLPAPPSTWAQEGLGEGGPPGEWVISSTLGAGVARGDYGDFLEKPVNFDLNISKGLEKWRFGGGIQFGSRTMKPPYDDEREWARFDTYLFARRVFGHQARVRPYVEGRIGIARIHPRSELFYFDDPENLEPGASPTKWANGVSLTLQPGVEIQLNPSLSLDVSGWWTGYRTGDYSTVPPLHGPVDPPVSEKDPVNAGYEYGLKAGLTWRPLARGVPPMPPPEMDPSTGTFRPLPPPGERRDAWGVSRSWGWASAEMLGINFGASMFNEYVRKANFNQISPRSWYDNFKTGWTWDDNEFRTNQLIHPFNGSTYFNSARANGIGFWGSSAMALAGAFVWECCGETHPMSWNDMISTGIGGVARGEWAYRLSSVILDNTSQGTGRIFREIAAGPVNPVRTFNRFLSGRATREQGNPLDPYDWRPPNFGFQLMAGGRIIGEGESISENTKTYGFIAADIQYGNAFLNERRRPYDRFDTTMQLNYGDKTRVGELTIRGDLASWVVGDPDDPKHVVAIVQDFDYIDNEAYEYGGQAFGVGYYSSHGALMGTRFVTRLVGYGVAGAAVNSDYAFLADVANRERFREYDYGPGVGFGAEAFLIRGGRPILDFRYRYTYISVKNGSIWNPDEDDEGLLEGSDADHQVHRFRLRLNVPITESFSLGAEGAVFYRDSRYSLDILKDVTQRNPEVKLFLTWDLGYTRKRALRARVAARQ